MTDPEADCLRKAALVLNARARKKTFVLRVIIKVLRNVADHIDQQADREQQKEAAR